MRNTTHISKFFILLQTENYSYGIPVDFTFV